jgi:hypothetical protein
MIYQTVSDFMVEHVGEEHQSLFLTVMANWDHSNTDDVLHAYYGVMLMQNKLNEVKNI